MLHKQHLAETQAKIADLLKLHSHHQFCYWNLQHESQPGAGWLNSNKREYHGWKHFIIEMSKILCEMAVNYMQ